jgi:uncharacterized protein YndB with AHSA1/START domain
MQQTEENITEVKSEKLVIVREFNAPIEIVWKAWTIEEHYKKWWGPKDYTCPVCKIDLRVGGKYLFCMRSPKGNNYWTTGEYLEISAPNKLVYTDSFSDENGNPVPPQASVTSLGQPENVKVTVVLIEKEGKTIMTLIHEGMPADEMKQMAERIWNEAFDKMTMSIRHN